MVTALRQYSGLDYSVTFLSFLFFSLPVFWIAVLMKQFLAIKFNDWLKSPSIPLWVTLLIAALVGLSAMALAGGNRNRRLAAFAGAALVTAVILVYLNLSEWFAEPGIGAIPMIVMSALTAVAATALLAGFRSMIVLYASLVTAGVGVACYFGLDSVLADPTNLIILGLLGVTLLVSAGIGAAMGGVFRSQAIKVCMLTGFGCGGLIFTSYLLNAVPAYSAEVNGVVIATIGASTPNFQGNYWETLLDTLGHLILPTIAIVLISFAQYTRYTRSSMLEVMNADYIRTARAKGLSERNVVQHHALRAGLSPVITLLGIDLALLVGNTVVTETVFNMPGLGNYVLVSTDSGDLPGVLAVVVLASFAVAFLGLVSDIVYAYLDPRVRYR